MDSDDHYRIYSSIVGIPFQLNLTAAQTSQSNDSVASGDFAAKLRRIEQALSGSDVLSTALQFDMESSYMYTNCSFQPLHVGAALAWNATASDYNVHTADFSNSTVGIVNNTKGFSIAYDSKHNANSTKPRRLGVESSVVIFNGIVTNEGNFSVMGSSNTISEAWCDLTTTYVEAQINCVTQGNCTVSRIRESRVPHNSSALTVLDGFSNPMYSPDDLQLVLDYEKSLAPRFLRYFVRSTGTGETDDVRRLSPLESYFANPDAPYKAAFEDSDANGNEPTQDPIVEIGDQLMSYRLSQLLNTYWLISIDPITAVSGIDLVSTTNLPASVDGQTFVTKAVLRCHTIFMSVLLAISIGLFGMGLGTAYLVATQKGPDVLDDFVNSLRHNPYVHVDTLGPSMEDGKEMAQRLKRTVSFEGHDP